MRVLHVTDRRFPPSPDEGGAPQSLASLVRIQRREGHEVWVATVADGSSDEVVHLGQTDIANDELVAMISANQIDVVHFHALAGALQSDVSRVGTASVVHVRGTHYGEPLDTTNAIYVSERHARSHGAEVYVHNGIDVQAMPFVAKKGAYLTFLGKVRRSKKGADTAVAVAKATDRELRVVGGRKFSIPQTWMPLQRQIRALGVLGGEQKASVLANASALLFPIRWEEPFGLVLIEAMACGTPVIAFNRGAVSEIVEDGVTGFVVNDFQGMCDAVDRIGEIDRSACRRHVTEHFSIERTAEGVMGCYERAIAGEQW